MKSEIERIRNANYQQIDRRVFQNNNLLDLMQQRLSHKKLTLPIPMPYTPKVYDIHIKALMQKTQEFKKLLKGITEEMSKLQNQTALMLQQMMVKMNEQINMRDCTIRSLQQRLEQQQKTLSTETASAKALEHSDKHPQLVQKNTQQRRASVSYSKQILYTTNNDWVRHCDKDKQDMLELYTHQQSKKKIQLNTHRIVSHSKQQLPIPDAFQFISLVSHKRAPSMTAQASIFNHSEEPSKEILRQNTSQIISKQQFITTESARLNGSSNKVPITHNQHHQSHVSSSFGKGRQTERQVSKQNGPVLPKPLRKNSVQSVRITYENALPEIPYISISNAGKSATENGFGVWTVSGQEIYRGLWKGGFFDGRGKLRGSGWLYEGEFKNGDIDGNGILMFGQGCKWVGRFSKNRPDGEGCLTFSNRSITGLWKKGSLVKKITDSANFT